MNFIENLSPTAKNCVTKKKAIVLTSQENLDNYLRKPIDETLYAWLEVMIPKYQNFGYDTMPLNWKTIDSAFPLQFPPSETHIIIGPTWDYPDCKNEFVDCLAFLEAEGYTCTNDYGLLRWNMDKLYLRDLREANIQLPKSHFVTDEDCGQVDLFALIAEKRDEWKTDTVILKPTVGSNSLNFFKINRDATPEHVAQIFEKIKQTKGFIIQEYIPQIRTSGELELVFINDEFQFIIWKLPKKGDDRVQCEHGGETVVIRRLEDVEDVINSRKKTYEGIELTKEEVLAGVEICKENMKKFRTFTKEKGMSYPVYARMDGIVKGNEFFLMELEIIECYLEYKILFKKNSEDEFFEKLIRAQLESN